MDGRLVHLHTLVLPCGASVGTDSGVPLLCRLFLHPALPSCLWNPPSDSKSQQCWHFGGKYKKPSSGHSEGVGLGTEVWIFLLLFGFYATFVLKRLFFSRETPKSLSHGIFFAFSHNSSQCPDLGTGTCLTRVGSCAMGREGQESEKHRIIKVGKEFYHHQSKHYLGTSVFTTEACAPSTPSTHTFWFPQMAIPPLPWGACSTLSVELFLFLSSDLNLSCCNLRPFSLLLFLVTWGKTPTPTSLEPPVRDL